MLQLLWIMHYGDGHAKKGDSSSSLHKALSHHTTALESSGVLYKTTNGTCAEDPKPTVSVEEIKHNTESQSPTPTVRPDLRLRHRSLPAIAKPQPPADDAVVVLPSRYELCEPQQIADLISDMLVEAVEQNDTAEPHPTHGWHASSHPSLFESSAVPPISIPDYLRRLTTYAVLTPGLLLCMIYYMDRVSSLCIPDNQHKHQHGAHTPPPSSSSSSSFFRLTSLTAHRFLIAAATVASKGLSDTFWKMDHYAAVGKVSPCELRVLERELLALLDWDVVPHPDVLEGYYYGLVARSRRYVLDWPDLRRRWADGGEGVGK